MKLAFVLFILSALMGVLSAFALPRDASAHTTWWTFNWNPPTSYNSCGWHGRCDIPTSGIGLDFGGVYAYVEVWALADDYWGPWPVVIVDYEPAVYKGCKSVEARTYEWKFANWQGSPLHNQYFMHVDGDQIAFPLVEYWGGPHQWWHHDHNLQPLAPMMNPDRVGCPWQGQHAHVENSGPWVLRNTARYPNAPGALGVLSQHDFNNWTHQVSYDPYIP